MSLKKLTDDEIKKRRPTASELRNQERFPIYVVIENVRSMYNVGSIFRTSDAACIQELILCGYTARPPRKEIDKTALGATETVPWRYFETAPQALRWLRTQKIQIVALEHCEKTSNLLQLECRFPIALLLGNEVSGISQEALDLADLACEIPMFGIKQSLNVSVAYGIAVYQVVQKFIKKNN